QRRPFEGAALGERLEGRERDRRRTEAREMLGQSLGPGESPVGDGEAGGACREERRADGPGGPAGPDQDGVLAADGRPPPQRGEEAAAVGVVAMQSLASLREDDGVDGAD